MAALGHNYVHKCPTLHYYVQQVFTRSKNLHNNVITDILEEEVEYDDFTPLKYEKWWYNACMDLGIIHITFIKLNTEVVIFFHFLQDQIEEDGITLIEELLDYFGGWPITMSNNGWIDEDHDWQSIHEYYSTFKDLSSFFEVCVTADDRNDSRNVIDVRKFFLLIRYT